MIYTIPKILNNSKIPRERGLRLLPPVRLRDHPICDLSQKPKTHQSLKEIPERKCTQKGRPEGIPLSSCKRRGQLQNYWIHAQRSDTVHVQ